MRLTTLIQYLFGNRRAIIEIANCRHAVWLGMLIVISAGFAREYDAEDLSHEPWHLLLPLGASLLTSFVLFLLLEYAFAMDGLKGVEENGFLSKYREFLGLYWMTAPLAWLYAFPVERFLDAADAVRANLWLLGIVSAWRVALMTRVVSVMYERSAAAAFFVVMLFADSVALAIVWLTPLPIVSIMGGISLTESEQVIRATGFMIRFLGTVTWLVWSVGAYVVVARKRGNPAEWNQGRSANKESRPVTRGLWLLSALSILIWIGILPFTQGEQINRRRVEVDLRAGRIEAALQYMSQRERGDFPPHWTPPPHIGYAETQPSLPDLLIHLNRPGVATWVQDLFREKLAVQSQADPWDYYGHAIKISEMADERLATYAGLLKSLPEGPAMASYHETEIRISLDPQTNEGEAKFSDRRRTLLEEILSLIPEGQSRMDK